jgi:hypothetical protein
MRHVNLRHHVWERAFSPPVPAEAGTHGMHSGYFRNSHKLLMQAVADFLFAYSSGTMVADLM